MIELIIILYCALVLWVVVRVIRDNRPAITTLAWILFLVCIPVIGLIIYYLWGNNPDRFPRMSHSEWQSLKTYSQRYESPTPPTHPLTKLLRQSQQSYPIDGNHIDTYTTFDMLWADMSKDIEAAQECVHFQFFKIEDDAVGRMVSRLLQRKVKEGVAVRVTYDALANWAVPKRFYRNMRKAGIEVAAFNPFLPIPPHVNYRNHRKVVVIDGRVAYVGGMNIAERYQKGVHHGVWRDTHIRITGPAVSEAQTSFIADWHYATQHMLNDSKHYPALQPTGSSTMQIVMLNPSDPWRVMEQALCMLIYHAKQYIYLQSPYFLPSEALLNALCSSALAGMDVRVMLPIRGDKGIAIPYASKSYYETLLQAGVRVYEYTNGYLHAKTVVCDDAITSVGSVNIDPRSMALSYETNAFIYDRTVATQHKQIFFDDMIYCQEVVHPQWQQRSRWQRTKESLARLLIPIL